MRMRVVENGIEVFAVGENFIACIFKNIFVGYA